MPKRKNNQCPVCFDDDYNIYQSASCTKCKDLPCSKCVAKMITVCPNGCGCASYICPTCRGDVEFMISAVDNVDILHGVITKFRNHCFGNNPEFLD